MKVEDPSDELTVTRAFVIIAIITSAAGAALSAIGRTGFYCLWPLTRYFHTPDCAWGLSCRSHARYWCLCLRRSLRPHCHGRLRR